MKQVLIFTFCLSLFFVGCYVPSATQKTNPSYRLATPPQNTPQNAAPGKCYSKCQLPEKKEIYQESYIAFTGDTLELV
jgi:hypothetical protein